MDILVDVILFEVGHLCVSFGTLDSRVWDDCWNLRFGEGCWCLGHDGWLIDIAVDLPKIPLQLLHCPRNLVRGSRAKAKDTTFYVTSTPLKFGLDFQFRTLVFDTCLITSVPLGLICLSLVFVSWVFQLIYFWKTGWFSFDHPLPIFLTLMLNSWFLCINSDVFFVIWNPYKLSSC